MNAVRQAPLLQQLQRYRNRWRWGLLLIAVLKTVALAVLCLLAYGLGDRYFALNEGARWWLNAFLLGFLTIYFLWQLGRLRRFTLQSAALLADAALGAGRRPVRSGMDLLRRPQAGFGSLHAFLEERSVEEAGARLLEIPDKKRFPRDRLAAHATVLGGLAVLIAVLFLMQGPAASRILARIFSPSGDLPPYGPLAFAVTPEDPTVIYGDDIFLQCDITGGELEGDVWFLTKNLHTGRVERQACYREGPRRFAQRLEKVTQPAAVAFASGKQRSFWNTVEVRLQPRVTETSIEVRPPSYSGLPSVEVPPGEGRIEALAGSTVVLQLHCNRPVRGGELTIRLKQSAPDTEPRTIRAEVAAPNIAQFTWQAGASANLAFQIEDLLGTPLESPLVFEQQVTPDAPPVLHILDPEPVVLATPASKVPVSLEVEDDLGLAKVSWVRSLVGYRERARAVAEGPLGRRYPFSETFDLAPLGVMPGQQMEFLFEASDENPSLLGVGMSDIVRVRIISEEDYAGIIRLRTTLREFNARYQALRQALDAARQSLKGLEEAAESGDPEAIAAATREARQSLTAAKELFENVGKDFQAFETDASLADTATRVARPLGDALTALAALGEQPDPETTKKLAAELLERLGPAREALEPELRKAEQIDHLGSILEMAAAFQKLQADQKSVATRFGSIAKEVAFGDTSNVPQLANLARVQERNEEAARAFMTTLRERADALPPEYEILRGQCLQFADTMEFLDIAEAMAEAVRSAGAPSAREAAANATLASQLLDRLIQERAKSKCPFTDLCQGSCGELGLGTGDLAGTLQQLLEALLGQNRSEGEGQGGGIGGSGLGAGGDSGSYMPGIGALDVPLYGPDRLRFDSQDGLSERGEGRGSQGRGSGTSRPVTEVATAEPAALREADGDGLELERVPESYREAVKRYFSPPDLPDNAPASVPEDR